MGFFDFHTDKQKKKIRLEKNKEKGKDGEDLYRAQEELLGRAVKRTRIGSDFEVTRKNFFTGKTEETKLVEIKTGPTAKLSKVQEKTRKKNKDNYRVVRMN